MAIANKELVKREKQLKDIDASMQQTVSTALEAENKANEYYKEIKYLQQQLEDERIQAELSMLRAVNELHLKHQHSLQMEKERFDRDYDKMENDFQKERGLQKELYLTFIKLVWQVWRVPSLHDFRVLVIAETKFGWMNGLRSIFLHIQPKTGEKILPIPVPPSISIVAYLYAKSQGQ